MPDEPRDITRARPMREQLQAAINENQVQIATRGIEGIDQLARRTQKHCEKNGIAGMDEIIGTGANFLKALLIRGISK